MAFLLLFKPRILALGTAVRFPCYSIGYYVHLTRANVVRPPELLSTSINLIFYRMVICFIASTTFSAVAIPKRHIVVVASS